MTFVTHLRLQSGDRAALDDVVSDLKEMLERKGVESRGPHAKPRRDLRVPLYRRLGPGAEYDSWDYTVYTREMSILGAEEVARRVGHREFPDSVHVELSVEQRKPAGHRRD